MDEGPRVPLRKSERPVIAILLATVLAIVIAVDRTNSLIAHSEEQRISNALFDSQAFRSLQQRVQRPAALRDSDDGTFVVFGLGENFPERFVRLETVRIEKRNGKVSKLCVDNDLEYYWLGQ